MSYDYDIVRKTQEDTVKVIKRDFSFYLKLLKGRHPRLVGGLGGCPITPELKEAVTGLEFMASHPLYTKGLSDHLRAINRNLVEPSLDMYMDVPVSVDSLLFGKQRPTQLEVLGGQVSDEEMDEIDKIEETDEDEPE